ncbi:hypothetical protein Tco_1247335 [Tanacetum coccineum]
MEYFDLWDSCMIKSLKPPKNGNQLRFLIQRVPSGRTSNALSIPRRFSASMFSSLIASVWASRIYDVIPGRVLVPPGSVVVPPGSVVVPTGSVVVPPGSVVVPTGSVVVPPGSVVVPTGSVVVPPGSVVVPPGSVITTGPRLSFPSNLNNWDTALISID